MGDGNSYEQCKLLGRDGLEYDLLLVGPAEDELLPSEKYSMTEIDDMREDVADLNVEDALDILAGMGENPAGMQKYLLTAKGAKMYMNPETYEAEKRFLEAKIETKYLMVQKALDLFEESDSIDKDLGHHFSVVKKDLKEAKEALESHSAFEKSDFEESEFL